MLGIGIGIDTSLTGGGVATPLEYYKTVTITGAAPVGYPMAVQVWAEDQPINEFPNAVQVGTNVKATQGIAVSSAYVWTSGDSATNGARTITTFAKSDSFGSGDALFSKNTALDFASHAQANGMFYDPDTGKLYSGANNFPTEPKGGWVLEYDVAANGSLTFVAAHDVGAHWNEGCAKHGGYWWTIYHDLNEIHQYDLSWNFVGAHTLPGASAATASGDLWQGIIWIGDVVLINMHGNNPQTPRADAYRWTGTEFTLETKGIAPPQDANQGMHLDPDGEHIWWAVRVGNISNNPANVIKTTYGSSGVSLQGRSQSDFRDVRITNADGTVTLCGGGHGFREYYSAGVFGWFQFALDEEIVTSKDFRIYYGNPDAVWSENSSEVLSRLNDFEDATVGDFTTNYNTGSATASATAPIMGARSIVVAAPTMSDGVYSDDADFIGTGLTKLTAWVTPDRSSLAVPGVYIARTVSGTTRKRGAVLFPSTYGANLLDNGVSTAFTSIQASTGPVRIQMLFDYPNAKYGAAIWQGDGIKRGARDITSTTADSGTRTYKDVMLFQKMKADNIFAQTLLATEPTFGAWSSATPVYA